MICVVRFVALSTALVWSVDLHCLVGLLVYGCCLVMLIVLAGLVL